jgi:hypothetical protein
MAQSSGEHEALVAKAAAMIIGRLNDKLAEITRSVQEMLASEVPDVAADGELLTLLYDAAQGNLDAFFPVIRHDIAIDRIEPPTAALEHARRMAQRGMDADALVRGYRLGHQAVVNVIFEEIRAADFDAQLTLDVFHQITSTSFRYVDRISQLVLIAQAIQPSFLGALEWRVQFRKAVLGGDRLRGRLTITSKRLTSKGDRGVVTSQHELVNQDGESVVVIEVVSLQLSRPTKSP